MRRSEKTQHRDSGENIMIITLLHCATAQVTEILQRPRERVCENDKTAFHGETDPEGHCSCTQDIFYRKKNCNNKAVFILIF